ncbi:MAG: phenylalanine 4-monooxygenase, partial [Bacteroidetes bacterium]|nr:phenylalanine 4-monooxygenase [Bacteroidota bacterium]
LEAFANTMSFRKGGAESVLKAIESKNPCTAVYSSGLQVTGVFTDIGLSKNDDLLFIKTTGLSALSHQNKTLVGHGKEVHQDGFSSPVGKLKNSAKALENFNQDDLTNAGIIINEKVNLHFESGISISGKVKGILIKEEKVLLISFEDCTAKGDNGQIIFQPDWGVYDMAVGEKIVSVFCGAADKDAYEEIPHVSTTQTIKLEFSDKQKALHQLYQKVRDCRENQQQLAGLHQVFEVLKDKFRDDWLCALEILEILEQHQEQERLSKEIRIYLQMKAAVEPELKKLINDGLALIANPVTQLIIQE